MTNELPIPTPPVTPTADAINFDITCVRCGYNLRGLSRTGRCPECGNLVELSLSGRFLRYADPAWLRRVRWGVELRALTMIALLGSLMIPESPMFTIPHRLLLSVLVSAAATYRLTLVERAAIPRDPARRSRFTARSVCAVTVASGLMMLLANALVFPTICLACASLVMDIAYLRFLAERIPDDKLAAASQSVSWALGICGALIGSCGAIWSFATMLGTATLNFGPLLFLLPCFAMIAAPIAAIVCFALLCKYALVIREQVALGSAGRDGPP